MRNCHAAHRDCTYLSLGRSDRRGTPLKTARRDAQPTARLRSFVFFANQAGRALPSWERACRGLYSRRLSCPLKSPGSRRLLAFYYGIREGRPLWSRKLSGEHLADRRNKRRFDWAWRQQADFDLRQ